MKTDESRRPAQLAAERAYYERNVDLVKSRARHHRHWLIRAGVKLVAKAKAGPCTDCRRRFHPICMDFDHVRGEKLFNIASRWDWSSLQRLEDEIAKCELVCSNCHRIRTYHRRRGSAMKLTRNQRQMAGIADCGHKFERDPNLPQRRRKRCEPCDLEYRRLAVRARRAAAKKAALVVAAAEPIPTDASATTLFS